MSHQITKLSSRDIIGRKGGRKISMLSAYDYPTALLAQRAGIEIILVGDSLGMTALGYDSTVPVTVDDILHHCKAVVRGASQTHVVGDLPFLSYHLSESQTLENAGRLLQLGGADSVKLEGGSELIASRVRALVAAGIPVMGHIGLTPQSGGTQGYGAVGSDLASAKNLISEARALAEAGVFSMVIEAVPAQVARRITEAVNVPTIGVGAGPDCDGQVVLTTDMLGIESKLFLEFSKRYAEIGKTIESAFREYVREVESGDYPGPELTTYLADEVDQALDA